jgi:4-amino-4-deoxy-L-arabinose transferase-like glycosyltransferase
MSPESHGTIDPSGTALLTGVNDEKGARSRSADQSWRLRLPVLALALGAALAAFSGLARTPLCEPAEGLNSDIARTMIESGDWVVPRHNGCIYVDKPPLFYWVTTLGLRIFGNSEFGARFGVALAGLGNVALIFLLGNLLYGRPAGLLAAAVLATSVGELVFARLMMVDTLFATCLTATFLCFAMGCANERRRFLWWTLGGAAAGLAVLTKSLIGAVLPVATIGLFVITTRQWRLLRERAVAGAVLGFLVVALPWHIQMSVRVPGFAQQYFWNEQVLRFFGQREPLDAPGVPLSAFLISPLVWAVPWSFFLPQMIWCLRHKRRDEREPAVRLAGRLPWLWFGTVVGFFALAPGRLFYYSLPSLAAFALLAGSFWSEVDRCSNTKRFRQTLILTMLAIALTAPLVIVAFQRLGTHIVPAAVLEQLLRPTGAMVTCLALGSLAGTCALLLRRSRLAVGALCCAVLFSVVPMTDMFAVFGRYTSLGTLVKSVQLGLTPEDVVVHSLVSDDNSELPFYLHHRVRILKRPGEFHQPITSDQAGYYIEEDDFDRLWRSAQPVFLMVSQPAMQEQRVEPLPPRATILARDLDAYICCNAAAARRFVRRAPPGGMQ